jgi:uncharacterized protein (DUF924 family)
MATIDDVVRFWFGPAPAANAAELGVKMKRWYAGGPEEDEAIRARFADTVEQALRGELEPWTSSPRGRLASILLLDQMTRSLFRGSARAFAGDARALQLANQTLEDGSLAELDHEERHFVYMPLLHAEDAAALDRFNELFPRALATVPEWSRPLFSDGIEQGEKYREIFRRFGRFPHRNAALGRPSTAEEIEFLKTWDQRAAPKQFTALLGSGPS